MDIENFSVGNRISLKSCPQCDKYNPNNPDNIRKGRNSEGALQRLKDKYNNCVNYKCNDMK